MNESESNARGRRIPPRAAAALALLAAFVLGVAVGLAADRAMLLKSWERRGGRQLRTPIWARSEAEHRRHWNRISEKVGLAPGQSVAVDSILARRARQLEAARAQVDPQMRAIMAETRRQIDSLLTPEQRERFESLRRERGPKRGRR